MKDWIVVALLFAVLVAVMLAVSTCDPEDGEEDDDTPVEPIGSA